MALYTASPDSFLNPINLANSMLLSAKYPSVLDLSPFNNELISFDIPLTPSTISIAPASIPIGCMVASITPPAMAVNPDATTLTALIIYPTILLFSRTNSTLAYSLAAFIRSILPCSSRFSVSALRFLTHTIHSSSDFARLAMANCCSTTACISRTKFIRIRLSLRWKADSVFAVLTSFLASRLTMLSAQALFLLPGPAISSNAVSICIFPVISEGHMYADFVTELIKNQTIGYFLGISTLWSRRVRQKAGEERPAPATFSEGGFLLLSPSGNTLFLRAYIQRPSCPAGA